ncbi:MULTISPECIES: type II toxin-antitoxin system RelE/ParE family toxin [unclassified Mesorhizobium]|uniref:type II toxin-antitoxin system RelE/ParE family toxin n=1 Tax=unclassified Mesorhizobium TaxID=325217 RepID=UPI000BB0B5C4|nr:MULTISPECIES: type II toxin-antitoxin system RelE/ParE family toxin [unclassified Mesorhizobium]TGT60504.1 type II toxin-antitoxin system RelE/ParE family toxin [Mesorhizobium sp. M00.F.Ca.ET.170.01.1.1]AZO10393.1 type II toxin-antitoxin system RelE/ParE family toxin [Mesorhizobium sp. M3A.F.Ca.ET.080.04.2.1]PBB87915.1 addiction module toxin RelE [Mesorhizobium sp. WSM3876]RWB73612.1 MAG: type II toxin-antitoxin system RelE/ParE family toxin [Mesorhizobium sp.]RWB91831.1 MAG: type II toxin-
MKRRAVVYTPAASDDLDRIYHLIAEASSATTASSYEGRIRAFCERLEYGSERGTVRDDVRPDLRVVGFERRVAVAFTVEPERVVILRLFYGGASWSDDIAEDDLG